MMVEKGANGRNFWGLHGGLNWAILPEERWGTLAADAS